MMDKKELSFLPLLALLLSAAVLYFSTCGTPEVGFVSDGDADGPSTILASGTDGIGYDLTWASVVPAATDMWSTYTNSTYGFSLRHPPEFDVPVGTLRFFEVVDDPLSPVFCRPEKASMTLHTTATTLRVGQTVTVSIALVNGETSNVRLGQPQYTLYAHPDVFSLGGMEPVERPMTLEPGQSDDIEFVLQATAPGRTMLMGTVGYEMHDLEYSWASWSGCNAEPLEITITP